LMALIHYLLLLHLHHETTYFILVILCIFHGNAVTFFPLIFNVCLILVSPCQTFFPHCWCQFWIFQRITGFKIKPERWLRKFLQLMWASALHSISVKSSVVLLCVSKTNFFSIVSCQNMFLWCPCICDALWEELLHVIPNSLFHQKCEVEPYMQLQFHMLLLQHFFYITSKSLHFSWTQVTSFIHFY
jgi:hypothetical protein